MHQNYNINLTFTANTAAAQAQVQNLSTTLNNLSTAAGLDKLGIKLQSSIMPGVQAASQLKSMLHSSMDDGNLNLAKFNASLKASGTGIVQLGQQMMSLGPQGQQAFQQMSTAILQAQVPLTRTKTLLNSLWGTLVNVAKWQIASNVLMGLVNGLKQSFEYAQELNESLTNIRIVTGYSAEAMEKFAKQANKAAKALSASTTAYTDAALIYYQQGLEGKAVEERAETTLKLANVTSQSAEEISQNLTAVWNNFYDGSKSIEYYADVMTALGAATASSSKEISEGLEKFAAVANTVGLSYEYATTALATVTAQTRQSADVVGTAFKTLFARIQDLELGETLDDGTTLGQYSEALYKVGINIKDSTGQLKNMDLILNEMGAKWQEIDKDQQVALAKSVAGIRQYTQLIALMDNWDTFEINLEVANNAEGTLQQQQEIWAESWEAAKKRVENSAQGLYDDLIDDDFFIDLNNALADLIEGLRFLIDAMGGLKGLLPLLIAGFAQFIGPKILTGIRGMSQEMAMTNKNAQQEILTMKELVAVTAGLTGNMSERGVKMQMQTIDLQKQALEITRELTKEEQRQLNQAFDNLSQMQQMTAELEKQAQLKKQQAEQGLAGVYKNVAKRDGGTRPAKATEGDIEFAKSQKIKVGNNEFDVEKGIGRAVKYEDAILGTKDKKSFEQHQSHMIKQGMAGDEYEWDEQAGKAKIKDGKMGVAQKAATDAADKMKESFNISKESTSKSAKAIEEYTAGLVKSSKASNAAGKSQKMFNKELDTQKKKIKDLNKKPLGETFMQATAAVGSLAMGISSLSSGFTNFAQDLKEGNLSLGSFLSLITSISMGLPMVVAGVKGLGSVMGITAAMTAAATAVEKGYNAEKRQQTVLQALGISLAKGETIAESTKTSVKLGAAAAEAFANGHKKTGIALALSAKAASLLEAVGLGALIPVKYADAVASGTAGAATMAMLWPIGLLMIAIIALVGIIFLLVKAFQAIAANTPEGKLKAANEELSKSTEAFNKATEAAQKLKDTINAYDSAVDKLKTLKKGTLEYQEAVMAANEEALKLIEQYDSLAGKYTVDSDGLIVFDEGALEDVQREQAQITQNALLQKQVSQEKVYQAEENVAKNDFATKNDGGAHGLAIGLSAASIGAAFIPLVGPLITGALQIGAGVVEAGNAAMNEKELEAFDKIVEGMKDGSVSNAMFANEDSFKDAMQQLEITDPVLIKALWENKDALKECSAAVLKNEKQLEMNRKQMIASNLSDNSTYQNYKGDKNDLISFLMTGEEDLKKQAASEVEEMSKADIKAAYAAAQGYDFDGKKMTTVKDGETTEVEIDLSQMKEFLIEYNAKQTQEDNLGIYIGQLEGLKAAEAEFIEQYGSITSENFAQYQDKMSEVAERLGITAEALQTYTDKISEAADASAELKFNDTISTRKDADVLKNVDQTGWTKEDYEAAQKALASGSYSSAEQFNMQKDIEKTSTAYDNVKTSKNNVESVMRSGGASQSLDLSSLSATDSEFAKFLEEKGTDAAQLDASGYLEQYRMLNEYQQQLLNKETELKASLQEQLEIAQAQYEYAEAKQKKAEAEAEGNSELAERYADQMAELESLHPEIDLTMNIDDAEDALDQVQERLEELTGDKYNIEIEDKAAQDFLKNLEDTGNSLNELSEQGKKVGNSYKYSTKEFNELMQKYPELAMQAELAGDGMMTVNAAVVEDYKAGVEEEMRATSAQKVAELQMEEEELLRNIENNKRKRDELVAWVNGEIEMTALSEDTKQELRKITDDEEKKSLKEKEENHKTTFGDIINSIGDFFVNIGNGISTWWTGLINWIKDAWDYVISFKWITDGWGAIKDFFSGDTMEEAKKKNQKSLKNSKDELEASGYEDDGSLSPEAKALLEKTKASTNARIAELNTTIQNDEAALDSIRKNIKLYQAAGAGDSNSWSGGADDMEQTKEKDVEEILDDVERYHEITKAIETQEKHLSRLAKLKDAAFGGNKLKLMREEREALEDQYEQYKKLADMQSLFLAMDREAVQQTFANAQFDENGNISNYTDLAKSAENELNAAKQAYNASSQDDAAKKALENAEKAYEAKMATLEKYETTLEEWADSQEDLIDIQLQIDTSALEEIDYKISIGLEINERDIAALEHQLEQLTDDLTDGVSKIANLSSQMDEYFDNIDTYKTGIYDVLNSAGASDDDITKYLAGDSSAIANLDLNDAEMEKLKEYTDGIMDAESSILDLRDEIEGQVMATFDAWHEKIEANGRAFQYATTMAESYKNIIDLVGKTRLNIDDSVLKDLEEAQMSAANGAMQNAKAQMDTTQNALNKAKEELEKAKERGNQDDIDKWEKDIETLNAILMEDQEAFLGSWETALQTAADIFTAQMDRAFGNLEDDLAGIFKSFDELSAAMDKQQQVTDRFMDAGKKQYELSKLNRKLQQDLDKTDNTKAQKELLKLQKEIESYQASGVEMSERDLTALQKKYELRLAEIALEDARNAKSQVRLTRDSEGNFGYVYTADESKVANAEQTYEDKLEENRQLAIKQNEQLSEAIVNNRQAMVEALREIRQEDYADTEAYMQALQDTTQFYKDQEAYLISEAQKVIERSQDIYANDYLAYDGWNLQKLDSANNYNTMLSDTQLQAQEHLGINTDGWVAQETELMQQLGINILDRIMNGDGSSGINGITAALGSAEDGSGFFGASRTAAETWASSYADIMGQAGITMGDYGNTVATVLGPDGTSKSFADFSAAVQYALYGEGTKAKPADGSANGAVEAAKSTTIEYAKTAQEKFGAVASSVTTWQKTYSGKITTATTDTKNLNTAIQDLLGKEIEVVVNTTEAQENVDKLKETINGLGDKTVNIKNNTTNTITTEYKTTGDAPSKGGTQGDGKPQVGDTVTFESGVYTADSYGGGSSGSSGRGGAMKISLITSTNRARPYHLTTTSGGARGWVSLSQISGYDTGGYTGEWGPDGKLAFLHQKEIVLNASDTENLLTAVSMIREISDQLESNALAMKYLNALGEIRTNITNNNKEVLEQEVTIHAEFPNATNHAEIEEAFRNLSTLASQYANRKN